MDYEKIIELVHTTKKMIFYESRNLEVKEKGPADYVTQVDVKVQEYMVNELKKLTPDVQIMAEEKENGNIDFSKAVWILDPIDGTTNLVHDFHHSAVSLAFYDGSKIDFGVIYNPYTEETFHAVYDKGAYLNGNRISVSDEENLKNSLIMIGTSSYYKEMGKNIFHEIFKIYEQCRDIRRTGSAALDLAYVACGRVEGFFERSLKPWDIAAGIILVEEAGGRISNPEGKKLSLDSGSDVVAGNKSIHEKIIRILNNNRR